MKEISKNRETAVTSKKSLLKYTLLSVFFALFTLVIIILPAEYNIDPTGIGHRLGLTVFSQDKVETISPSVNIKIDEEGAKDVVHLPETITVTVPAGRGVEYKFKMQQYQKMTYEWKTDGSALYFDLHGEPKGDTTGYFESYAIATLTEMKGSFTSPFTGVHGWYWKNTSPKPVTVQLITSGEYGEHGLK